MGKTRFYLGVFFVHLGTIQIGFSLLDYTLKGLLSGLLLGAGLVLILGGYVYKPKTKPSHKDGGKK